MEDLGIYVKFHGWKNLLSCYSWVYEAFGKEMHESSRKRVFKCIVWKAEPLLEGMEKFF